MYVHHLLGSSLFTVVFRQANLVLASALLLLVVPTSWGIQLRDASLRHLSQRVTRLEPVGVETQDTRRSELLRLDESKTREINGGEARTFNIPVASGQYLRLLVQQHSIILTATLSDANGQTLTVMDNPSGGQGPIEVSAITTAAGDYRLEVRSTEEWANAGSFDVSIEELRDSRPEDKARVDAERAFAEGSRNNDAGAGKLAIDDYEKAVSYWQAVQDYHWEALTQYGLGQAYRKSANQDEAVKCFNLSLRILDQHMDQNDWRLKAAAWNDLGSLYADSKETEKAIAPLNQALSLFEAHGDLRGQGSALNNLARAYGKMGQLHLARENAEKALPLRQAEHFRTGEINLLNTLGIIDDKLGDTFSARERFMSALAAWQELDREFKQKPLADQKQQPEQQQRIEQGLANAFNSLALANDKLGDWNDALEEYNEALARFGKNSPRRAATLDNRGELHAVLGDLKNADQDYNEALSVIDSLAQPDSDLKASLLLHLGQSYLMKGDLPQSLSYFESARAATSNRPKIAYILANMGTVFALQGSLARALEVYRQALAIQADVGDKRGEAITRQKMGETLASLGREPDALEQFNLALTQFKALTDRHGEAATLNNIGLIQRDRNDLKGALQSNEEATKLIESMRIKVSSYHLRTLYFATQQNYYELNVDLNMKLYRQTQSAAFLAGALEASERSRARNLMDTLIEARANVTEGASEVLLGRQREVEEKIRAKSAFQIQLRSTTHDQTSAKAIANELVELIDQSDRIKEQIITSSPRYATLTQPQILTATEIQRQLENNTLLLEYSLGEQLSYVWALTPDSVKGFQLPPRKEIEATAQRLTKSLTERNRTVNGETVAQWQRRRDQSDRDFNEASVALSKMVLGPVGPLFGNKRLVIVADGALHLVSFAALPLPGPAEKQRRLIDDHEIVYEPSASVLALQRREFANRKRALHAVVILADPVFASDDGRVAALTDRNPSSSAPPKSNGNSLLEIATRRKEVSRALEDIGLERFPRLRSSAYEAQKIIDAARKGNGQSKAALSFDASRETAMSSELSEFRIVHFATHAVVDYEHPELSGIVLSLVDRKGQPQDGYLRLHDIYNLSLPVDLIVLSACQTGVGKEIKGEGLIALTRGFMYAGAERVVASLWKVDDAATAELMAEFYKQMFVSGQSPAAALRAAQITLKKRSPADWAGFVLQGEWK